MTFSLLVAGASSARVDHDSRLRGPKGSRSNNINNINSNNISNNTIINNNIRNKTSSSSLVAVDPGHGEQSGGQGEVEDSTVGAVSSYQ